jgi:uncharacterized protein YbaP (TraB family)
MQHRFHRFALFVALLVTVSCGSSKERVDTPQVATSASAAPVASDAPSASATASSSVPEQIQLPTQVTLWKPLLYRIGGTKPSYLFGTIHIPDDRLTNSPSDSLKSAFHDAEEVVTELPLDDTSTAHATQLASMPNGKTLSSELPKATYDRLKGVFVQGLAAQGLPRAGAEMAFSMLEHMKVWAIAVQVSFLDHIQEMSGGKKPIDVVLHDRAKALNKRTSGLETEAEQLNVFDALTKDEQTRFLEEALDERDKDVRDHRDSFTSLMGLYLAGEEAPLLAQLNAGFDATKPLDQKLLKRLITDRNKIMTDRITAKMKGAPPRVYLFAVGAAHLLGDDGIIAQLKKKGVTVERVP